MKQWMCFMQQLKESDNYDRLKIREEEIDYGYGRTEFSCRHDNKFSLKMNKKILNRRVRRYTGEPLQNAMYKRLGKDAAWDYAY